MEDFCDGEPLWDIDLTWSNNTWPQFTDCFHQTVLTWVPCAWLWLLAPLYIYYLSSTTRDTQTIKWLFCIKVFCSLVLILLSVLDITEASHKGKEFTADLLSPLLWAVTMCLHICIVVLERTRGVIRSPNIFFFWILTSLAHLVPFYSSFVRQLYEENRIKFAIIVIKYITTILVILANCFADYNKDKFKGQNPEPFASVLSWLSFSWVDRLMIKGFKAPLKDEDVYEINPRDQSERTINKLLKTWNKEKSKVKNKARIKREQETSSLGEVNERSPLLAKSTTSLLRNHDKHTSTDETIQIEEERETKVSLIKVLIKCYWSEGLSCQWGMVMFVVSSVVSPIILGWLISFTKDATEPSWHGYMYALAFIVVKVFYTSFSVLSKYLTNCFALRVCSAGIAAVFRKALSMSSEARKESTAGEIVNLMSVDSGHLEQMLNYSFWLWICIAFLVIGIYLLYTVVGIALLSGIGFVIVMFCVNLWVMQKMREYQGKIMIAKDERVKVINEVLNGIKVIKLYGWEPMFIKKIQEIRDKELSILLKYCILDGVESFAWMVSMFWMLHLMLVTFVLIDDEHYLDANTTFLTMNFIDILKLAINILPILVKDWVKAGISVMRMNKYLNADNIIPENLLRDKTDDLAVRIENAHFSWERNGPRTLQNINLLIPPGQLVAIVGTVGSGKSSLLNAMLGEMHKMKGHFNLNSSVAYVPQMAWIQNNSLRDNILFGQQYNSQAYNRVLSACALLPDLEIMPAGDLTEIGEKGINLSGGQKQRVSLARAVYSQADIYLLDDPLSAVDSHVGKHIFDKVLSNHGLLTGKTRILVTHGIQWLPLVDHIVVMSDGEISERGTYEELLSHNGSFAQFLNQHLTKDMETAANEKKDTDLEVKLDILKRLVSVTSDNDTGSESKKVELTNFLSEEAMKLGHSYESTNEAGKESSFKKSSTGLDFTPKSELREHLIASLGTHTAIDQSKLVTDEEMAGGKVNWGVYWHLMKSIGFYQATSVIVLMLCYHVTFNYTNIWLADWSDDTHLSNFTDMPPNSTEREDKNVFYIAVYTGLGLGQTIFVVGYSIMFQVSHVATSRKLHNELLYSIIRAPMSFFDTTPIGRILNRFSQDIATLDNDIFLEVEISMDNALRCVSTVIIISYTMPIFLSVVVPVMIILYFIQHSAYQTENKIFVRMNDLDERQLYIRTSCQLRRITSKNRSPVYAHFSETLSGVAVIRAYQAEERFIIDSLTKVDNFQKANALSRAINKWLEARLEMLNYIVIAAATIFAVVSRNDLSPGLVGLAVTYAMRVSTEMNIFTLLFGELENHVVSVERIREYSLVNSEAPWEASDNRGDQWPSEGRIEFVNFSTRYRDGLALVLNNLNCCIKGGEKVGVVGRTGAGKSSMVLSLFRLIEAAGGKIVIDGVDICKLGLHAVRRKLTILPQDPVLFAGSLRTNLDPFGEKSESELWTALQHAHLKGFVESLPEQLEHEVGEGGENLSMGQRQLVCLARTLLRKTKILILDEATAAVDMETDELIQKTIRAEFIGCTILTIAHRLNTVIDYDRIMVLDKGTVTEFDSPKNLLANPNSMFYAMASQAGLI